MDDFIKISGANLKLLREKSGLTQMNVADYLKIDQSLVSMVEQGKRSFTSDMLEKLTALFGVTISAFNERGEMVKPLSIALRANEISDREMEVIAAINRIALNCNFMTQLLESEDVNG